MYILGGCQILSELTKIMYLAAISGLEWKDVTNWYGSEKKGT